MDYTLTNAKLRSMKAALTRAVKSGSLKQIEQVRREANTVFEQQGYPDCWQDWDRAYDDALLAELHK